MQTARSLCAFSHSELLCAQSRHWQDIATSRSTGLAGVANDLRLLMGTANVPIIGIDPMGHINEWNRTMATITGFPKEDVIGQKLAQCEFIDPEMRTLVTEVIERALKGYDCENFEVTMISEKEKRIELLLSAATWRSASGAIVGVVCVGQDVTEKNFIMTTLLNAREGGAVAQTNVKAQIAKDARGRPAGRLGGANTVDDRAAIASLRDHLTNRLLATLASIRGAWSASNLEGMHQAISSARLMASYLGQPHLLACIGAMLDISPEEMHERIPAALAAVEALVEDMSEEESRETPCASDIDASRVKPNVCQTRDMPDANAEAGMLTKVLQPPHNGSDPADKPRVKIVSELEGLPACNGGASGGADVLNYGRALANIGGDPQLLQRMLTHFTSYSENIPAELRAAAATRDLKTARRQAHSLKGSASYIGAVEVRQFVGSLPLVWLPILPC